MITLLKAIVDKLADLQEWMGNVNRDGNSKNQK